MSARGVARERVAGATSRRTWAAAVVLAALVHGTVVGIGATTKVSLTAVSSLRFEPSLTVETVEEQVLVEAPERPGGGSAMLAENEVAVGDTEEPEAPLEVAARATEKPPEPVDVVDEVEPLEDAQEEPPGAAAVEPLESWLSHDALLAQTVVEDEFALRPRAAFKNTASRGTFAAALPGDEAPVDGRSRGLGGGRNGGPGGLGGPGEPLVVQEDFAFGGKDGAFLGRMCFVRENLPSLKALGACATRLEFRTNRINIPPRRFDRGFPGIPDRDEWFSILYTGTITVSKPGRYEFRVLSDDGSVLHIDGVPVVDNDGLHGPSAVEGEVELSAGPHRLELWYFQGPRLLVALQVFVTPPGEGERLLEPQL